MRLLIFTLLVMICLPLFADSERASYTRTFVDTERQNRQIPVVIYYPEDLVQTASNIPYIVFGHGWIMNHSMYSTITNTLLNLGWIVIYPRTEENLQPNHLEFAKDLSFLAGAALEEHDNPNSILYDIISLPAIVMGHSMGGGAAVLAAAMPNSFASLITFCAAETSVSAIAAAVNVTIPSITLSGSSDTITPPSAHQIPIYQNLSSNYKSHITITGAGHLNLYSNILIPSILEPWLNYIKSESIAYLRDFEDVLEQNSSILTYDIVDNLVVLNSDATSPSIQYGLSIYPNPMHTSTNVEIDVKEPGVMRFDIFNLRGQKVYSIFQEHSHTGKQSFVWDGTDAYGTRSPAGLYLGVVSGNQGYTIKKLIKYSY